MRDRKSAQQHYHPGVVGWISSTDVMTFGMILMFALAVFLQSKVAQSRKEIRRLRDQNSALVAQLGPRPPNPAPTLSKHELEEVLKKIKELEHATKTEQKEHTAALARSNERIRTLNEELEGLRGIEADRNRIKRDLAGALAFITKLQTGVSRLQAELDRYKKDQRLINRELLGLKGPLKKTVILIDASGSMAGECDLTLIAALDAGALPMEGKSLVVVATVGGVLHIRTFDFDGRMIVDTDERKLMAQRRLTAALKDQVERLRPPHVLTKSERAGVMNIVTALVGHTAGRRWEDAVNVMKIWLGQLPISEVNMIVFNHKTTPFPSANRFLKLDGEAADTNRRELVNFLKSQRPDGGTFTRGALENAYLSTDIDSIILFTDGAPNTGNEDHIVKSEVEQIYALIKKENQKRRFIIPINAIGVGAYFDPDLSEFLLGVRDLSNGIFIGR